MKEIVISKRYDYKKSFFLFNSITSFSLSV